MPCSGCAISQEVASAKRGDLKSQTKCLKTLLALSFLYFWESNIQSFRTATAAELYQAIENAAHRGEISEEFYFTVYFGYLLALHDFVSEQLYGSTLGVDHKGDQVRSHFSMLGVKSLRMLISSSFFFLNNLLLNIFVYALAARLGSLK